MILNIYLIIINEYNNINNETINLVKMKEIYLNGDFNITNIRISNDYDILISLSNGALCVYNHSNRNPEYYLIYHHKALSNFIWYEKQKSIISVSHDKSIKIFQIPLKWPGELIRKNKKINDINIIEDMNKDTKKIFYELEYGNKQKYNEEINTKNNEQENNKENENKINDINILNNIWDIGNIKLNNSETQQTLNDKFNHNEINKAQEYIFYFEKSIKYFHSFSDDLDGWSN